MNMVFNVFSMLTDEQRLVGPARSYSLPMVVALLVAMLPAVAYAEAVREVIEGDSYREVIRMTVTPADEPTPVFKYRLTLLPHELEPGNSVAYYMRSFPEGGIEKTWQFVREEFGEEVDDWYDDNPIGQLPMDKFIAAAASFQGVVQNHIAPGSRRRETDWGVSFVDIKGPEIISFLLPEMQGMRSLARAVAFRTRLAIVEHRYEDAIEHLRINYRLGRDVGEQPILVSGLVGIAICGITNQSATDLIAAPDSPNLYWALSELPRPQVSLRDALRLEMAIAPRMFEILDDPENKQRSNEEWNAMWKRDAKAFLQLGEYLGPREDVGSRFVPLVLGVTGYAHAKDRLMDWGYSQGEVDAMAVGQVLAIYSARVYETIAGELEKVAYVDHADGVKLMQRAEENIQQRRWDGNDPDREILPVASVLLPAVAAARSASFRIERDLDALRIIEAMRMHAARNEGTWPKSLDDITCVPVPENVATGEPFEYRMDGGTAILTLPMSDGLRVERQYELTLAE